MIASIIFLVFPLCLVMAALTDLIEMKIPNRIPAILSLAFLSLAPFVDLNLQQFAFHLLAGIVVFAGCFALFALGAMGGGDAKLLTAAALWFGFNGSLVGFLATVAFLGGILTILLLIVRARANTVLALGLPIPSSIVLAKKVPYGIAIGAAGLISFPQSPLAIWAIHAAG
ncbi:prepilin peptidase [Ciceribacter sp. L1K22]|uniref:A24 family peptidase n=1 Tax=Ciceribacter sp. L1K22 TaxID=2820275 RepID=UPI001ABEA3EE|nr:prepilin peptidase [Ciceribacter sp. L1K22]MBO3758598.1 prepilin peptidase [Ciceribacter sp. L1K22]